MVARVGGTSYVYDANGNLTGRAGRTYTWTVDNLPLSVSQTSGNESYTYPAAGSARPQNIRTAEAQSGLRSLRRSVLSGFTFFSVSAILPLGQAALR